MAEYSYAGLQVRVTADTAPLRKQVNDEASKAGDEAGRTLSQKIGSGIGRGAKDVGKGIATALGTGVIAMTAFGVQSIKVAAGVDKMNATLGALAKANGVSQSAVTGTVTALRKQGVQVEAAQSVVASFVKEHLGLANATKLTTVAQNASVVSGKSVSDVMEGITKALETGRTRQLASYGLIVNSSAAYKDYAAKIGTTVAKLTDAQKHTALINAVMEQGKSISGAWAATLNDPARVLASFPRIAHDIQVSLGEHLLKAFGPLIVSVGGLARGLRDALAPGGKLGPIFTAIGSAASTIAAPFTQIINLTTKWLTTLKPSTLSSITTELVKFAPAFASIATALAAFAGKNLLGGLPVLGPMLSSIGGPLGIVVTGLATLALTSPAARNALMQLAQSVMAGLAPVLKAIVPIVGQLGTQVGVVLAAALQALLPLVPPLVDLLKAVLTVIIPLVPVITVLADVLAVLAPYIVQLAVAWAVWQVALKAYQVVMVAVNVVTFAVRNATLLWTAAQWLLNAALDANPIGVVVIALAALALAIEIAWQHSQTFRTIVVATWAAVSGFVLVAIRDITGAVVAGFHLMQSVIGSVSDFIHRNIQTLMLVLVGLFTAGLGTVVILVVRNWAAIKAATSAAVTNVQNVAAAAWHNIAATATSLWANITGVISRAWSNIVNGARLAGGQVISGLKSGMAQAISGIGSWIKSNIVDPIVNHVKSFFGIHSPSTVMAEVGGNLVKGLFVGMVPGISGIGNLVGQTFGGFPAALATLISHGLVGVASLPGKALSAIMGLFGQGNAGQLATTASGYNGHRYVWGGGANAQTGFDCSSFVNMLSGMLHLPNPGGLTGPSPSHGPVTTGWLGFGSMGRVGSNEMRMNDLYVSPTHMGVVTGPGRGFAARSTATGTGPQPVGGGYDILRFPSTGPKLPGWLSGVLGKLGGLFGHLFGGGGTPGGQPVPGGVAKWKGVVDQVLGMFGRPDLEAVILAQMMTESGGNQFSQNNWDSNAKAGTPSKGLMQVIQPTFDSFAGPFRGLGIFNPLANVYAAVAYALSRYGGRIASVLGHGHGYATGGIISEPVTGFGLRSGEPYSFGEVGPELVSPLSGPGATGGRIVINVYPSAGMDERELAALVSRELAWATAGGYR